MPLRKPGNGQRRNGIESNTSRFDLSVNIIEGLDRTWYVQAEYSTSSTSKLTAPDFERLAFTPCPMASLASSGIKALSSLVARSWSRKALRVLRKSAANSAQEFDELISTMRMASMRGRGDSAL